MLAAASAAPFVTPMDAVGWGTVLGGGPVRHNSSLADPHPVRHLHPDRRGTPTSTGHISGGLEPHELTPVSYTHLTLPTKA